jgi:hypothetical protein
MRYADKQNRPWYWHWYNCAHWRRLRAIVLARDPICKMCNRYPSEIADHVKPHKGVRSMFVDLDNLQGLCKKCHDTKTATEDGGFGNAPLDPAAPTTTGTPGRQFQATSVGDDKIDKALGSDSDMSALLEGL